MNKIKEEQKTLDAHLREIPKPERVVKYTELGFQRAAVEWLIATDQVSTPNTHRARIYKFDIVLAANKCTAAS